MIDCCRFVATLQAHGWDSASGVPCSTFSGPIAHFSAAGRYEASANEGLALASAVGAGLAGHRQAVILQNSGLGNLVNPLASLSAPYHLPVLAFMSLRGWPDPTTDEPQHAVMGTGCVPILDALGVWHTTLDGDHARFAAQLDEAEKQIEQGRCAFLLVPRGTIGEHPQVPGPSSQEQGIDSADVAAAVALWANGQDVVFSTTGYLSRYLFASGDRPGNFYMQGSMGHASAIALGYCRARPDTPVVVLDGDGAALMHLGVLSTIGAAQPTGLTHVIVDNGSYASTGGQATTTRHTDLAAVAAACGYRTIQSVDRTASLQAALEGVRGLAGPHCIVVRACSSQGAPPPRASASMPLKEIADRLRRGSTPEGGRP